MVFSDYTKQRILIFYRRGYRAPTIAKKLRDEGIIASRRGIWKFLTRYLETGTIKRKEGSSRPTKITSEVKRLVETQMRLDDETTAVQLFALCNQNGINLSLATILRARTIRGWTFRGSAYCQLIRDVNKVKRRTGQVLTCTTILKTLYGRMNAQYKWSPPEERAAKNRRAS